MELVCSNCSEPLEDGWSECPVCDTPVSRQIICPSCRKEMKSHWNKCPFCKTSITGTSTAIPVQLSSSAPSFNPHLSVYAPSAPLSPGSAHHPSPGGTPYAFTPQPTQASATAFQLNSGEKLANDRFTILRQLGHGGFGSVYLASDSLTGRELALKVVCPQAGTAQLALKQLLFEHEIRRKIHNIKHILGAELPLSCDFKGVTLILMPMDYSAGGSLRQWLVDHPDTKERKDKALAIFRQVCDGVTAIHEAGIVHLDLKPENILLEGETVKICDFGLSRGLSHQTIASSELMRDGIGTPAYMAPEQILAARPQDVDHLADIYSLGVILFEMLDGDPPYVGTALQILEKIEKGIRPKLRDVEERLAKVIWKCLERDEAKRYQTIPELLMGFEFKDQEEQQKREECIQITPLICPVTGMEFVKVPGGSFEMGDIWGDGNVDEDPVHRVTVSPFLIGKYPVTQSQWERVMGSNPSWYKGSDRPVEQVSWNDCQEFIRRLNRESGRNYRLPSEAEWEYAARSGGKREKYAGTDSESNLGDYAWYDENSDATRPVGRKRANGLDIFDMSGNVFEWCQDWYDAYPNDLQHDPQGPSSGSKRVNRGGCWRLDGEEARTSARDSSDPDRGYTFLGLRLVFPISCLERNQEINSLNVCVLDEVLRSLEKTEHKKAERKCAEEERKHSNLLVCPFTGMEFVKVPGGAFDMGDVWGDGMDNEGPVQVVTVRPFLMGKYPVTQSQWVKVMGNNPSHFKGESRPVDQASWEDSQEFIKQLNRLSGRNYRMPSEAEWEYAARSGGKCQKWAGAGFESNIDDFVWYYNNSNNQTHPVGQKLPNEIGLYDMCGNVREWCQDVWHNDYSGAPTDGSAWEEGGESERRMFRGGSWGVEAWATRTTHRDYLFCIFQYDAGLRLVLPLD